MHVIYESIFNRLYNSFEKKSFVLIHQRLDFRLHVLIFSDLELLNFLPFLILLRTRSINHLNFWWRFLFVIIQHVQDCVSLLFQLNFLICVGVADDIFYRSWGSGCKRISTCWEYHRRIIHWGWRLRNIFAPIWLYIRFRCSFWNLRFASSWQKYLRIDESLFDPFSIHGHEVFLRLFDLRDGMLLPSRND